MVVVVPGVPVPAVPVPAVLVPAVLVPAVVVPAVLVPAVVSSRLSRSAFETISSGRAAPTPAIRQPTPDYSSQADLPVWMCIFDCYQ